MPTDDANKPLDGVFALLPEAYFDLLARIVPGMIAIILYGNSLVASISSGTEIMLLILFGYVIGFLLDAISEFIVRDCWDWLVRFIDWLVRRIKQFFGVQDEPHTNGPRYGDYYRWQQIRNKCDAANRAVLTKMMMAEKAGFRGLAFLFLFTLFWQPDPLLSTTGQTPIQVGVRWLLSNDVVLVLISGSCFATLRSADGSGTRLHQYQKKASNQPLNPNGNGGRIK